MTRFYSETNQQIIEAGFLKAVYVLHSKVEVVDRGSNPRQSVASGIHQKSDWSERKIHEKFDRSEIHEKLD